MKRAKIVIGANYGDCGKGSATDYFAHKAIKNGDSTLVVLHNGSCQRSHTVELSDGTRHAFRHFGSGTFVGADTYFSEDFIVNPIYFREEYERLEKMGITMPKIYANASCRVGVPYDAFVNQVVEYQRGENAHGSCGYGVWETVLRNQNPDYRLILHDLSRLSFSIFRREMYDICKYSYDQLEKYNIEYVPEEISDLFCSAGLITRLYEDIQFFFNHVILIHNYYTDNQELSFIMKYDTVVFEGGQGLALDEDNFVEYPNFTPSKTGSHNPYRILKKLKCFGNIDIEVCYVTRSYLTRHGAGKFPTECIRNKGAINSEIEDHTNVYNQFQGSIRYGYMDLLALNDRIKDDYDIWKKSSIVTNIQKSLMITHLNYTDNKYILGKDNYVMLGTHSEDFDNIYTSNGKTREYTKIMKKDGVLC